MQTFTGTAKRGQASWIVTLQGLSGDNVAIARTWREAKDMSRELVAHLLETSIDSVDVILVLEDEEAEGARKRALEAREKAQQAKEEAEVALVDAARVLTRMASVRDVGAMLDLSHQHIAKLAPKNEG